MKPKITTILLLVGTTLFGLLTNGYRYGIWDQSNYIPMVQHAANSSLFTHDYMFDPNSGLVRVFQTGSLAELAIARLSNVVPLEYILFTAYLIGQFCLFATIYALSLFLFRSRGAAALAVLLLATPKMVAGTAIYTQEMYFTFRNFAMPLAIAFLIPFYAGHLILAATICGVIMLLHLPTATPVLLLLLFRLVFDPHRNWKVTVKTAVILFAFSLPQLVQTLSAKSAVGADGGWFSVTPEWVEILKIRQPYVFVGEWSREAFLSVGAYMTILALLLIVRRRRHRDLILGGNSPHTIQHALPSVERDFWTFGVLIIWMFVLIGEYATSTWPIFLVVRHSVDRGFHLVIHLSLIYAAWFIWQGFEAATQVTLDRNQSLWMRAWTLAVSKGGLIVSAVVAGLLAAALFATEGNDKLMAGGALLVAWIILTSGTIPGPISPQKIGPGRRLLSTTVWLALIVVVHKFIFFQTGVKAVLASQEIRVALTASLLFIIIAALENKFKWGLAKVTAGALLLMTGLGIVAVTRGRIRQTLSPEMTEYINLPGVPLRSNWAFQDGRPYNDWIDVGLWCRTNTPLNALFFVPPDLAEFRVHAQRGIVGDWADGGSAFYTWAFAQQWWSRMADLKGYDGFDETQFQSLKRKYLGQFAVTRTSQRLGFPVQYQNSSFTVYALSDTLETPSVATAPVATR